MAQAGEIGAKRRAAEIIERGSERAGSGAATTGSSRASTRWLSVCPSGMSRAPAEIQFDASA